MSDVDADACSAPPVPPIDSFVEVLPVAPQVERRRGILRFYGRTDFAEGEWAGVELVGCDGRNDGTVKGVFYFKCAAGQGIFVRPNLIMPYAPETPTPMSVDASAKVEKLEEELRVARRAAAEREKQKEGLEKLLHSIQAEVEQLRIAAAQAAAKSHPKTEDEDDELAAQVQLESVRLQLQHKLDVCEAELKTAKQSAREAAAACAAAEKREQQAERARECSEAAQAALQTRNAELQMELTRLQAELASAVAQQSQSAQNSSETVLEASAACTELRNALQAKEAELLQLRTAHAELCRTHERLQGKTEEQERVEAAERHYEEKQRQQVQDTAREDILATHASEREQLQAEIAAMRTEKEAWVKAQREKEELQELCRLLEEELNEQKVQSDALTHLVEELGAAKVTAEAAVEAAQQSAVQERARLLRELEDARAREVPVTEASAVSSEGATGCPSMSSTSAPEKASLEMALQQCRDELDEARARILQLSGSQQVVQELQRRCEELTEAIRVQRAAAQTSDDVARATLAAAQQQHAEQVAQLREVCEAAQREAAFMATQVNLASISRGANGSDSTVAAVPCVSPLDAFREDRYEARIRSLQQLLLECSATRMSSAIWDMPVPRRQTWCGFDVPLALLKEPVRRILDFSTRDACAASTRVLFQAPSASP